MHLPCTFAWGEYGCSFLWMGVRIKATDYSCLHFITLHIIYLRHTFWVITYSNKFAMKNNALLIFTCIFHYFYCRRGKNYAYVPSYCTISYIRRLDTTMNIIWFWQCGSDQFQKIHSGLYDLYLMYDAKRRYFFFIGSKMFSLTTFITFNKCLYIQMSINVNLFIPALLDVQDHI